MSEDENKGQKSLWKNLKTEKNKYMKEDDSHFNSKGNKMAHSLDQALEEVRMSPEKRVYTQEQVSEVIQSINRQQIEQPEQKNVIQQPPVINKNSDPQPDQQILQGKGFFTQSENNEEFDFPQMPRVEIDSQEEQEQPIMMFSNGTTANNPIALFAAKSQIQRLIQDLRYQYDYLVETFEREKKSFLTYLDNISETIILQWVENQMNTPSFQTPTINRDQIFELEQILRQKQMNNEELQRQNQFLKAEISEKNEKLRKGQSLQLQIQLQQLKKLNKVLEQKIDTLSKQNQSLNEAVFDYEQRIAQMDLQIQQRIEKQMQKKRNKETKNFTQALIDCGKPIVQVRERTEGNEDGLGSEQNDNKSRQPFYFQDREFYINEMANMEKEIQKMSENYLRQEEEYSMVKEQLYAREEQLKARQFQMQNVFKEIQLKNLQLQSKMENVRKKEYQIQIVEQQLKKRQVELDEKNRELIHREIEMESFHKKGKNDGNMSGDNEHILLREGHSRMHDLMDTKYYGIKSDHGENGIYQAKNHVPLKSTRYGNVDYGRASSRSGEKSRKFDTSNSLGRNYKANFKSSAVSPHVIGGSGISKHSYNKSKSIADSSRLNDLGNKLEKLREEIRKEIRDAV